MTKSSFSSLLPGPPVLASAIAALAAAYGLYTVFFRRYRAHPTIPGPDDGLFYLGNINRLQKAAETQTFHELFDSLVLEYGEISAVSAMGRILVVLANSKEAKRLVSNPESFKRSNVLAQASRGIFARALFALGTDDHWHRNRKMLQPAFGPLHLKNAASATAKTLYSAMENIRTLAHQAKDGLAQIEVYRMASAITADVIGLVGFSTSFNCVNKILDKNADTQLFDDVESIVKCIEKRSSLPPYMQELLFPLSKVRQERDRMFQFISNIIAQKRARGITKASDDGDRKYLDLLDRILEDADSLSLTDEEIFEEFLGMFFAGHDTSANVITNILYEVATRPEIQEKIRNEANAVLGDRTPTYDLIQELKYVDCVMRESLRLFPVATVMHRIPQQDSMISGHLVKKGSMVIINISRLHRDPALWEKPDEFIPDRWSQEQKESLPQNAYLPFGDGPHQCIGMRLAQLQIRTVIATLVQNFNITLIPGQTLTRVTTITTGFKNGLMVKMEPIAKSRE